jgi:hypothetical protein
MFEKNNENYADLIFLFPGKTFSQDFIISWSSTMLYVLSKGLSFKYSILYTPIISDVRNSLLLSPMLENNYVKTRDVFSGKLTCKKVIFIDSDIVWSTDDIEKLIFTSQEFLSGVYKVQFKDYVSVLKGPRQLMTVQELTEQEGLFEAYSTGFGFVSCSYNLLNTMKYPWFSVETYEDINEYMTGEDSFFCLKARSLGYKIMVDSKLRVGHLKTTRLTI